MVDANQKLRQAFDLMKSGNKNEAAKLTQEVLQADRNNVRAWWMMTNLLEDDNRKIKALERVLSLQPDHTAANKMMQQLDPSFKPKVKPKPSAPQKAKPVPEKPKNDDEASQKDDYFGKLEPVPDKKDINPNSRLIQVVGWGFVGFIGLLAIGFVGLLIWESRPVIEGPEPDVVVTRLMRQVFRGNEAEVRELLCTDEEVLDVWLTEAETANQIFGGRDDITISTDATTFETIERTSNRIRLQIGGELTYEFRDQTLTMSWEELNLLGGGEDAVEALQIELIVEDNRWVVCST